MPKSKNLDNSHRPGQRGDTLYYDGSCPLCSKEIAKLTHADCGGLRYIDISNDTRLDSSASPDSDTPSKEQMLRRLHLRTESGQWLVGLRANIYAWRNTSHAKYWRLLALPFVFPIASGAYELWAKIRFRMRRSTP